MAKKLGNNTALFHRYTGESVSVGQAKSRLVASIYNVARRKPLFTAADVWAEVDDRVFRRACADSRLIAAAFAIARRGKTRIAKPGLGFAPGDRRCNRRPQREWISLVGA